MLQDEDNNQSTVQEVKFSSDEEFDDDEEVSSESDIDAKLAEDDVFDIEFFKCYSALKKKDEKIYDKNVKFFNEVDEDKSSTDDEGNETDWQTGNDEKVQNHERLLPKKTTSGPRMTLLDHQLSLMTDDVIDEPKVDLNKEISKSYYEKELEEIKRSIEKVSENIDSDDDEDLLVVKNSGDAQPSSKPRKKIQQMLDKLEEEEEEDISHLKQIWSEPNKLSEEDKFLRNYIVNKLYIPQADEQVEPKSGFFSENIDQLSDADEDEDENDKPGTTRKVEHHSDEKDFDKIIRIPRNSTKTIRDLVEKREKKEKRMKALEKEKKKKKMLKDADCEDIVGDLPTRFGYRETEPNDYGLSAEELLMATDEELEKWAKLKDAIAYRSTEEELAIKRSYEQKRNDMELKRKIFTSIYGDPEENESQLMDTKSKKKKRKRKHSSGSIEVEPSEELVQVEEEVPEVVNDHFEGEDIEQAQSNSKKKKHRKRGLNHKKFAKTGVAPDRLLAYGISKTRLKKSKLL